jgi:uncharacterized protein VirK/YbjX
MDRTASGGITGILRVWRYASTIGRGHPRRGVQFLARAGLHWSATTRWLAFLDGSPLASAPPFLRADLAQRVQRRFSRGRLTPAERARLLIDHYGLMADRLRPELLRAFLCAPGIELAHVAGRQGEVFRLTLSRDNRYAKEGELTFGFSAVGTAPTPPLATLTCVLGRDEAGSSFLSIGGLQGPPRTADRRAIAAATRALDGLRPKHAALEAALAFARWFPVSAVIATSRDNHVHAQGGRRAPAIKADYAGFWREQGGVARADGDYQIPLLSPARPLSAIESKRRAGWKRRRARRDRIAQATVAALEAMASDRQAAASSITMASPGLASSADRRAPCRSHTAAARLSPSPLPGVVRLASQR